MLKRLIFSIAFISFAGYFICEAQPDVAARKNGTLSTSQSSGGGAGGSRTQLCSINSITSSSNWLCNGSFITLNANFIYTNQTAPAIQWYLDSLSNPIAGETGTSLRVSSPGTYYFALIFEDKVCYDGVVVSSLIPFDNIPNPTMLCQNSSVSFTASFTASSNGLSSPSNYQWYKDGILLPNETNPNYTATNTGNYFVKFTASLTGNNNCSLSSESINASIVPVLPPSKISVVNTTDNCIDTLMLNITSSDLYPANISWFDPSGNLIETIDNIGVDVAGGSNGQLTQPYGIFIDQSNNIYVGAISGGESQIMKFSPGSSSGTAIAQIPCNIDASGSCDPAIITDVIVNGSSVYYSEAISGYGSFAIGGGLFLLGQQNNNTTTIGNGNLWGLSFDNSKNIYFSSDPDPWNNSSVNSGVISNPGGNVGEIGGANIGSSLLGSGLSNINYPNGVYVDANNNVFVADNISDTLNNNYGRIVRWAPGATSGTLVAGGNGSGNAPNQIAFAAGITLDKYGNLYVTDPVNKRVQLWKPGANMGITIASGFAPWGIKVDDSDNVYVADQTNNQVLKFPSMFSSNIIVNAPGAYKAVITYPGGCQDTEHVSVAFPNCSSPGTFLNFTGQLKNSDALLKWQTISKENASYYDIQRSPDSVHFSSIGKVDVSGTISSSNNYSFSDKNVTSLNLNKIYYRLNEVETDGTTAPSNIICFAIEKNNGSFIISPNPVRSLLKVQLNNLYGSTNATIFDMAGRRINVQEIIASGNDLLNFNTENLTGGLYIIQVLNNGQTKYLRFVKE